MAQAPSPSPLLLPCNGEVGDFPLCPPSTLLQLHTTFVHPLFILMSQVWQKGHRLGHQTVLDSNPVSPSHLLLAPAKLVLSDPQLSHLPNGLLCNHHPVIQQTLRGHWARSLLSSGEGRETKDCAGVNQSVFQAAGTGHAKVHVRESGPWEELTCTLTDGQQGRGNSTR